MKLATEIILLRSAVCIACETATDALRLSHSLQLLGVDATVEVDKVIIDRRTTGETAPVVNSDPSIERNERVFVAVLQGLAANASLVPTTAGGEDVFANRLVDIARRVVRGCYDNRRDTPFDPVGRSQADEIREWKSWRSSSLEAVRHNHVEFRRPHNPGHWVGNPNNLPPELNVADLEWRPAPDGVKFLD